MLKFILLKCAAQIFRMIVLGECYVQWAVFNPFPVWSFRGIIVDHSFLNAPSSFIFSFSHPAPTYTYNCLAVCGLLFLDPPFKYWVWVTFHYPFCRWETSCLKEPPMVASGSQISKFWYRTQSYWAFIVCKTQFRHMKSALSLNLHSVGRDKQ